MDSWVDSREREGVAVRAAAVVAGGNGVVVIHLLSPLSLFIKIIHESMRTAKKSRFSGLFGLMGCSWVGVFFP
jgi:hypothetical protein